MRLRTPIPPGGRRATQEPITAVVSDRMAVVVSDFLVHVNDNRSVPVRLTQENLIERERRAALRAADGWHWRLARQ